MVSRLALVLALAAAGAEATPCRQGLVFALDVSGSVDAQEYRLQLDGLAAALAAPDVREVLLAAPEWPMAVAAFEWSGPGAERLLVPWSVLGSDQALNGVIARLRTTQRIARDDRTGLGAALSYAAELHASGPDCLRQTVDISGDGKNNAGAAPDAVVLSNLTVNALVIGADSPHGGDARQVEIGELSAYFNTQVIRGPNAFVAVALGYDDYARAMREKILKETEDATLSALPSQDRKLVRARPVAVRPMP